MINVNPFPSTKPKVVTIGKSENIEVSYDVTSDVATKISTSYTALSGCSLVGTVVFDHNAKAGVNNLKDTIALTANGLVPHVELKCCNENNECDSAKFKLLTTKPTESKAFTKSLDTSHAKKAGLSNTRAESTIIKSAKKAVKKFLKKVRICIR